MTNVMNSIPPALADIIRILGGMLPLIGFAIILKSIVKKSFDLVYFIFGFILFRSSPILSVKLPLAKLYLCTYPAIAFTG
jgi:mannose/fructose/N-acetylgalactosamine-specific phosphotransferase system component IIC